MTHSWDGYKDVAENLNKFGTENNFRSAISRAYYYAFNIGVEQLRGCRKLQKHSITNPDGTVRRASVHENVSLTIEALGYSNEALSMSSMRTLRNRCDYDHSLPIILDQNRVALVIKEPEVLVDFFRKTFSERLFLDTRPLTAIPPPHITFR